MLNRFLNHINKNQLGNAESKTLLAVSGGIDSACMARLYHEAGFNFAIAHCNFQLRGKESDGDQKFVENLASQFGCELFIQKFDTLSFCKENGVSVQMGARELRYNWFQKISDKNNFHTIAIAHNRNDIAETMLINLIRGTGLKGLTGIKAKMGKIVRPLLFASREEITTYAKAQDVAYREDSSNKDTKYHRNLIRKKILPLMQKINPSLIDTLIQEADIFNSSYQAYRNEIENIRMAITIEESPSVKLSIAKIQSLSMSAPILYDLLTPYDFTYSDAEDIMNGLNGESGKKFQSDKYVLIKDRNSLIIEAINKTDANREYYIGEDILKIREPIHLDFIKQVQKKSFIIPRTKNVVALDFDKLKYPLKLRHWKEGDSFIPFGMKGKKKLSDFFTNQKINILDKKKIWLLLSGNDIVWIVNWQIDERYKITSETKNILSISLNN